MLRNTASSWGTLSRALHWILGFAVIGMLAYGWWMNHFPARPDRFFYRSIHADIGYVVLLLTVLRLTWPGVNPTPALPDDTSRSLCRHHPGGDAGLGAFRRAHA